MKSVRAAGLLVLAISWMGVPVLAQAQAQIAPPGLVPAAVRQAYPAGVETDMVPRALHDTRVVAFGEYHGTQEIPKLHPAGGL